MKNIHFIVLLSVMTVCMQNIPAQTGTALHTAAGVDAVPDRRVQLSEDLTLLKVTDNTYIHISFEEIETYGRVSANGVIFVRNGLALMIDTPWTDQETGDLIHWIKDTLQAELQAVIVTHWHQDCMGGLAEVHRSHVPSYGSDRTAVIAQSKGLPVPVNTFSDSMTLSIGGEPCILWFPGEGHTTDNITVWIPSEKLLFAGCMLKSMDARGPGNTADANLAEWPASASRILRKFPDCEIVIPGHGRHGGRELITHTIDILNRAAQSR